MRPFSVVLLCLVLLAGCTTTSAPEPSPTSSTALPSPAPSPSESLPPSPTAVVSPAPPVAPTLRPMSLGSVVIDATGINAQPGEEVEAHPNADGSVRITARIPDAVPSRLELHIEPATVDTVANRGITVVSDAAGEPLAAVPLPTARDADGRPVPTRMSAIDSALVFTVSPEDRHEGEVVVDVWVGRRMIDDVTVGEERGEPRYSVTRTEFGHAMLGGGLATPGARELFESAGWEQALDLEPALAEPASLRQQFDCHVLGAAGKQSWNLEAFRPDNADWVKGALEHRCNWSEEHLPGPEPSPSPSE